MRADLKILFSDLKGTVVYVTHDQLEAMTLSDRLIVMKDGLIQQIGIPDEVYEHPNNLFVAGFIGSPIMNFIKVDFDNGHIYSEGINIKLSYDQIDKIHKKDINKQYILGIRPEDISIVKEETSNCFYLEVIEDAGSEYIMHLQNGINRICLITKKEIKPNRGDKLYLEFINNKIHLFDCDTENAVF